MGKGKALTKLAAIGAAIAGVVFFWRKRQEGGAEGGYPPAADTTDAHD
ncbi:MAG TPA: DLW-39 family protein [Acidimicrobiia bacterium]|nr:DLW-39 family protein [Acidimicrobiia bacterium]